MKKLIEIIAIFAISTLSAKIGLGVSWGTSIALTLVMSGALVCFLPNEYESEDEEEL